MKILGIINEDLFSKASEAGFKLNTGTLNKKDGRVRIFCRQFPGTTKSGYALRSRIVWWLYTGEVISGTEYDIHHRNHNRADDRIENLEKLQHSAHAHEHNGFKGDNVAYAVKRCENCDKIFKLEKARLVDKSSGTKQRGRFCSQDCYHQHPKVHYKLHQRSNCVNGHEYTDNNIFWIKRVGGLSKGCRTCKRIATKKQNDKRKSA
jgi:hypothetical protein